MTIKEKVLQIMDDLIIPNFDGFGTPSLDPTTRYRRLFRMWLNGSLASIHMADKAFEARRRSELREIVFEGIRYVPPSPYTGAIGHYYTNGEGWQEHVRWLRRTSRLLRAWVINQFVDFVAYETGGAHSTVQRYIVASVTEDALAQLTGQFIDEALELISYGMTDDPSEAELEAFDSLRNEIGETYASKYLPEQYYSLNTQKVLGLRKSH